MDKWLWAVRLYKTRSLAAAACRGGKVTIGGEAVKPSRCVRVGDLISASLEDLTRTLKVLALIERRVGPKLVSLYAADQTPAAEYLKQVEKRKAAIEREPRSGRPTKRDRRAFEKAFGGG
jgi:ribosome-associated heat shock protein Hsp15